MAASTAGSSSTVTIAARRRRSDSVRRGVGLVSVAVMA